MRAQVTAFSSGVGGGITGGKEVRPASFEVLFISKKGEDGREMRQSPPLN